MPHFGRGVLVVGEALQPRTVDEGERRQLHRRVDQRLPGRQLGTALELHRMPIVLFQQPRPQPLGRQPRG
jgi:hypothetical protein